jgi:hypothetical protein
MTNPIRKLTDEQVAEIKEHGLRRREANPKQLAHKYGIHRNTVLEIWRGRLYRAKPASRERA